MIAGRSVLGVIPARGGSRSVPRKNIRLLAGKPLIAWTILAAQQSRYLDRLILTSEDDEIIFSGLRSADDPGNAGVHRPPSSVNQVAVTC
jgi:CMP-N-acetylneuraminic acid synthetase